MILSIDQLLCCYIMGGGNLMKTCPICLKTMRGDHLKRHMKVHQKKPQPIHEAESHSSVEMKNVDEAETKSSLVKYTGLNFEKLERNVDYYVDEFNRKIELGRNLKIIINEKNVNTHALPQNMKDALHTYELYGKKMDMQEINWRGWQMELRQYLDKPSNRKVIWVVGVKGNEGKSFFQRNICEEFSYKRVCRVELNDARDTFHIVGKEYSENTTDIFLFNVPRAQYLYSEQYKILESIKDGWATSPKYNGRNLRFKMPNVLMVFANREPDRKELSQDRWVILKISKDLMELSDITDDVKKKKKMVKESYKSDNDSY